MAIQGKFISQLDTIGPLTGTEIFYVIDNSGVSRKMNADALADFMEIAASSGALLAAQNLGDLLDVNVAKTNLALGTLANQDDVSVDLNGGTIDNISIGFTNPDIGIFTNLTATGTVTLPINSISVTALQSGIPNNKLLNDSVTITAGSGLTGGGVVSLGDSVTLDFDGAAITNIDGGAY